MPEGEEVTVPLAAPAEDLVTVRVLLAIVKV